ncbi:F-box/FBD/LRR-repeat protein At1g13570-like isoform X3 [Trifolium pratense]|uniref:F-box/FBD/LRR-repeat protein At1g13570-like isoform X1 n=2 Tax=Trifolium pratense TaxID=57577 RepID=UPI001E6946AF|nr:F-box/FBD/LRR-repeat protein At1g13570-like isoform X1 [Trifolium pratense]XP_045795680.1 F-box/FBD/LRR-repeat protein At1g13570-like isoform X3 [Trifolium pratense]
MSLYMSLFNKKANQDDHIDRISDLPSNVIDGILEHLSIRDVVRTSILSTNWRYMWTSVPTLEFQGRSFLPDDHLNYPSPVVSKIITDVLMLHNGPIYKFNLFILYGCGFEITLECLNTWIPFLSRNVKHLELVNHGTYLDKMPYIVFSCKELTKFRFGGFNLSIPPNFSGFKRLLNLKLESVTFESGALESLISGCPLLEKLSIEYCHGFEYFHISTPTLKVLYLEFDENIKSICLKKAQNLSDLTLVASEGWVSGLIKSLPKNMQRFCIASFSDKKNVFADIIPPTLLKSSFNSIKYLILADVNLNERREVLYIVSVLKSAPCLVELVIQNYSLVDIAQPPDHSEELECRSCCLNQLKTVNIKICATSNQDAMSLIRFILATSTSLKTLTFDVGVGSQKLDALVLLSISQDLLLMKRASQRAEVKFLH